MLAYEAEFNSVVYDCHLKLATLLGNC